MISAKIVQRSRVALELRKLAKSYRQRNSMTGNEFYRERAERLEKQAFRYQNCGREFVTFKCKNCKQVYFGENRCESRICEKCAKKHANRIRKRQIDRVKELPLDGKKRLAFLTLTIKAIEGRSISFGDIKRVGDLGRKLFNKHYPRKWGNGTFAVIEVGNNNNIHIHALVYGYFVPQDRLSQTWLKITKNSPVVFIKGIKSPIKCVNYLLKYISKPPEFNSAKKLAEFLDAVTGTRRIRTYGIFYNYMLLRKASFACVRCGGLLSFIACDGGFSITERALSFKEAMKIDNNNKAA